MSAPIEWIRTGAIDSSIFITQVRSKMIYADWLLQVKAIDDGKTNRMRMETGSGANGLLTNTNRVATFYEGPLYTTPFERNVILGIPNAPPTTPTLYQTGTSSTGFTLSWSGAIGATSYSFIVDDVSSVPAVLTTTSATWTGFASLSSHTVVMTAYNYLGSATSPPFDATAGVPPPDPPTNVSLLATSAFGCMIAWEGAAGATSYTFTLNGARPPVAPVVDIDAQEATFTGLVPSTTYTIIVQAVNVDGKTDSDPFLITTAIAPPTAVRFLSPPLAITSSGFTLQWSGGAGQGVAYTFTVNGAALKPTIDPVMKTATWTGLDSSTPYSVIITATNTSGSTTSPAYSVTTTVAPPTPPVVTQTGATSEGFTITWTGANSATSYRYMLNGQTSTPYSSSVSGKTATWIDLSSDTTYFVVVFAINSTAPSGVSSGTNSVTTGPPAPTAPRSITQTATTSDGFTLAWDGGTYAAEYEFTLNGQPSTPSDISGEGKFATWTGLDPDTSYNMVVIAKNGDGSTPSLVFVAATAYVPPTAPTGLSVSNVTASGFVLSWSGGAGATSYTFPFTGIDPPPAPFSINMMTKQATWRNLTPVTSYIVFVTATDRPGSTTSATGASVTTSVAVPTRPVPTQSGSTPDGFTVSWTGGTYATSYTFTLNGAASTPASSSVVGKTATWTGLAVDTPHTVNITAVNVEGSTSSGSFSVRTGPGAPSAISQSETTYTGFKISWTPGTGATSYTFTVNGSPVSPTISGNTATFTGLTPGVTYSIVVISVKGGLSSPSAAFNATTSVPPPPTTPVVTTSAIGYDRFTVAWTGGVGALTYSLLSNGVRYSPNTLGTNTAKFTGLRTGTSQSYVFDASNNYGTTSSAPFTVQLGGAVTMLAGGLTFPYDVYVDAADNIIVANTGGNNINLVTPSGSVTTISSAFNQPYGAVSNIDGNIYVANTNSNEIARLTPAGVKTTYVASLTQPRSLRADRSGNLYLVSFVGNSPYVIQISPTAVQTTVISGLTNPTGLWVDPAYNIYVPTSARVLSKYALSNGTWSVVSSHTFSSTIKGVSVNAVGYIAVALASSVEIYTPAGDTASISGFNNPNGLCFNAAGTLYVADTGNNRVAAIESPPLPPTTPILSQSASTNTSITIAWTGGTGATSYSFTLDGAAASPTVNGSTAVFTGLTVNTSYIIVVTAINGVGSTSSAPFTATTAYTFITSVIVANQAGQGWTWPSHPSAWSFGTGDFTYEWFQKMTTTSGHIRIFDIGGFDPPSFTMGATIENGVFRFWENGVSNFNVNISSYIADSRWAHIAVVRASGQATFYINGNPISNYTSTSTLNQIDAGILFCYGTPSIDNQQFQGALTNVHIMKGYAKYTQAFRPPSSPIQGVVGYTIILMLGGDLGGGGYGPFGYPSQIGPLFTSAVENVYPPI